MQSTLLEYGQQNILLANLGGATSGQSKGGADKKQETGQQASGEGEKHLKRLMKEMAEADKKQVRLYFDLNLWALFFDTK